MRIETRKSTVKRFIASGFSVGFIPKMLWGSDSGAGTLGAGLAALVSLALWKTPWWTGVLAFVIAFALSLWSSQPFAESEGDPGWVCIDEMAGTFIAVIGLTGWPWVVAVVVARLADIFKVLPGVRQAEDLHGAVGITMDDVLAGLYGLAAGWVLFFVLA